MSNDQVGVPLVGTRTAINDSRKRADTRPAPTWTLILRFLGIGTSSFPVYELLVPKPILLPTVRALPCDAVTGHAPHVFIHADLTNSETTPAGPAKRGNFSAAMASLVPGPASFPAICLSS
jgi:hypothetical protein